jgi:hypothetical protein
VSAPLIAQLEKLGRRKPLPTIDIALADGNRISLEHWRLEDDCVVGFGPDDAPRYLVPIEQIVLIEITES